MPACRCFFRPVIPRKDNHIGKTIELLFFHQSICPPTASLQCFTFTNRKISWQSLEMVKIGWAKWRVKELRTAMPQAPISCNARSRGKWPVWDLRQPCVSVQQATDFTVELAAHMRKYASLEQWTNCKANRGMSKRLTHSLYKISQKMKA